MNEYYYRETVSGLAGFWDVVQQGSKKVIAICPSRRIAVLVIAGLGWMEGETGDVDWQTEGEKP